MSTFWYKNKSKTFTLLLLITLSQLGFSQSKGFRISAELFGQTSDFNRDVSFDSAYDWNQYSFGLRAGLMLSFEKLKQKNSFSYNLGIVSTSHFLTVTDLRFEEEYVDGVYVRDEALIHGRDRRHFNTYLSAGVQYNYYFKDNHKGLHLSIGPEMLFLIRNTMRTREREFTGVISTPSNPVMTVKITDFIESSSDELFSPVLFHVRGDVAYSFRIWRRYELEFAWSYSFKLNHAYTADVDIANRFFSRRLSMALNVNF